MSRSNDTFNLGDKWFVRHCKPKEITLKLFCFPFAGGSSNIFNLWPKWLPNDIQVISVEYPGRGRRFSEPLINCMDQLVSELEQAMTSHVNTPYAFYGHSLGALVSFALAKRLVEKGQQAPQHMFLSGKGAPSCVLNRKSVKNMEDNELISLLKSYGATPIELLDCDELMHVFLPIIRNDFILSESYVATPGRQLPIETTLLAGEFDSEVRVQDVESWRDYFSAESDCFALPGDHFFINSCRAETLAIVRSRLSRLRPLQEARKSGLVDRV